ncbi:MAG: HD domain-containing protein, partial [Lachnospiraceae bacterium]|nr:HD domain-containing protein [Lachnospiraceae bacterium]
SAYIKCIQEKKAGNDEFADAESSAINSVRDMGLPEAEVFLEEFLPAYSRTLDAIKPDL